MVWRNFGKRFRRAWQSIGLPPIAILIALLLGAVVLWLAGYDPLIAYRAMWQGAFKDLTAVTEVLIKATPLIFIGAGLAIAFRCSIWNIGAEGQFYLGAIAATAAGIYLGSLPRAILMPLVLLLGIAGGAMWGMLAGFLKNRFGANEVVTTIMLNYIAIFITGFLVTGPMIETKGLFPQTPRISENAWLPRFLPPTRLHLGFIIALLLAIILYILLFKTSIGYTIRAVGTNAEAARYAGINVQNNILLAMGISGGAAGLAGAVEVAAISYRLYQLISPGYGFDGIAVSLLVGNNPLGVIFSGILFGALRSGSEVMQMNARVPSVLVLMIQGMVVLSVVAFGVYRAVTMEKEE
ncbi:MAG: ABC transporter permease [Anaerolineales bacterium]|nr:ABC transporter permease [Anaerolineales bacterium]MDW8161222.1 ABC transporter permease [Anaerolineales bacterium]